MTDWTFEGMAKESQTLSPRQRLGSFLRQQYPGLGRDKRLAADLTVSPRTARNLFEDHWPSDDTFAAIVRRFGEDLWRVLVAPEIAPVLADLEEKEARLERELEGLRSRRREVAGRVVGYPHRRQGDHAGLEAPGPLTRDLFEEARP